MKKKPKQVAFCPEHGKLDKVDEDGLCPGCGATCMGDAIDELFAWSQEAAEFILSSDRPLKSLLMPAQRIGLIRFK